MPSGTKGGQNGQILSPETHFSCPLGDKFVPYLSNVCLFSDNSRYCETIRKYFRTGKRLDTIAGVDYKTIKASLCFLLYLVHVPKDCENEVFLTFFNFWYDFGRFWMDFQTI